METEIENFDSLNLNENLLKGVYLHGFTQPSKIQIKGISSINTGKDCILQSQSGTGKTATYLLGVMNRLEENKILQGIVIAPTRELAEQIYSVATSLSQHTKFKIVKCTGGTSVYQTIQDIKSSNMVIGTMGRINHMIEDNKINPHNIKFIVMFFVMMNIVIFNSFCSQKAQIRPFKDFFNQFTQGKENGRLSSLFHTHTLKVGFFQG